MNIILTKLLNLLPRGARSGAQSPQHGYKLAADPKHNDKDHFVRPARRLGLSASLALFACCLPALQSLQAAPAAFPMQPGEIATTYYSGSNPNTFNVEVVDVRPPYGPLGANWLAPMFHNEFPVTANTWNRANLGEVFGICLDNANPPNIYVTATIVYGSSTFGPAGSGGVYKLNGVTGAISTFGTIPPGPASLGNICFDAVNNQFFVSSLEDGWIYRLTGGLPAQYYNHGVSGRPNQSLAPIADSGTPGLTAAGRRVWGLQVYNSRLYYSVWNVDQANPSSTTANEIWSVGINPGGTVNLGPIGSGGPKREISLPAFSGNWSSPVSDIAFSKSGKMLLAERSTSASGTTYGISAHQSRVLEYKLVGTTWVASGNNYSVGAYYQHYNSAGGVDYDCQEDVLATGDALMYPDFPPGSPPGNSSVYLYGIQIIPAGGNTPATSISTSYLIDSDGDTATGDKTHIGDVVDYRENCGCLAITNRSVECINSNNTYAWNFCVINQSANAIGWISITDLPSGVTVSQDLIPLNPVLQPGQGQCFTLLLSLTNSAVNLTNVCFTIGSYSTDFFLCCSTTNCLTLAPCCAYVPPKSPVGPSESLVPIPGQPNCYNYTVTVRNVSSEGAEYIFFTADPTYGCLTFTPDITNLPTVLPPNGQVTVTVEVCLGPAPCGRCFLISLHDACCSTRHCLPSVAGPITIGSPADGSLFLTPASIPLAVTLTPDIKFSSVSYVANGEVVASNSVPPFSAIWSNAPAGDYVLRADGTEAGGGGVWNSDPVTIYVLPQAEGTSAPGVPTLTGVQVSSAMISFTMQTAPGVTYQVEYSDSIISPNWQPIGEIIVGDGGVSALSYSRTNAPQRFYRVRVQ